MGYKAILQKSAAFKQLGKFNFIYTFHNSLYHLVLASNCMYVFIWLWVQNLGCTCSLGVVHSGLVILFCKFNGCRMSLSLCENYLQDITHYTKIYNFSFDDYGIKVYYGDR